MFRTKFTPQYQMDHSYAKIIISLAVLCGGMVIYGAVQGHRKQRPPGPFRLPLVGNALQMPQATPWLTFSKWSKIYGNLMHVDVFGRPIVIISSTKVARDLLDKRSSIYSSRPHLVMAGDLSGYSQIFVLLPYGENWRQQRRLVAHDFSPSMATRYYPLQEKEARIFVRNILEDPSSLIPQIKLRIGISIMRVTYGYYIQDELDPFLQTSLKAMTNFSAATAPGGFLVDFIPFLRHVPLWMPGSEFLMKAKEWRKVLWDCSWNPYIWTKENMDNGAAFTPNLCGTILQEADGKISPEAEATLVWAASTVMGGGLDTNISTALTFFLAMILYPEVQDKARQEIISVVGTTRLPAVSDRASLPYTRSLIAEVFRWNPSVPMGIPHSVSQDDVYEGMYIPKDTLVMANVWHMLHDPELYEDPMAFKPERYQNLDSEMQKVINPAFGFGRRACPGIHFAEATLYTLVSTTLACCEILPELDALGKPIIPEVAYTTGSISFPKPFQVRLKPCSPQAVDMLKDISMAPE